jgi:hypothetical protein
VPPELHSFHLFSWQRSHGNAEGVRAVAISAVGRLLRDEPKRLQAWLGEAEFHDADEAGFHEVIVVPRRIKGVLYFQTPIERARIVSPSTAITVAFSACWWMRFSELLSSVVGSQRTRIVTAALALIVENGGH